MGITGGILHLDTSITAMAGLVLDEQELKTVEPLRIYSFTCIWNKIHAYALLWLPTKTI